MANIFSSFFSNGVRIGPIEDSTLIDYNEVLKHHERYTRLLSTYVNNTRINLYAKNLIKVTFFIITMWIWITLIILFKSSFHEVLKIINSQNVNEDYIKSTIDLLAALVPSLISLITSFIVIPKIIAKYLFNMKEEKSMIEIIKSLQTYDNELYKYTYNKELLAHTLTNRENVNANDSNMNSDDNANNQTA